jgi:hypothetical protein
MNATPLDRMNTHAQSRTERKLKYAEIHIAELREYAHATSNDDWENAHQESCFYHLAGAVEAILHEINDGHSLEIPLEKVSWSSVGNALAKAQRASPALQHLSALRNSKGSWLAQLFEWRNHGTHRRRVNKIVNLSTVGNVDNEFLDPRTGAVQTIYPGLGCQDVLERLANDIRHLIQHCRTVDAQL